MTNKKLYRDRKTERDRKRNKKREENLTERNRENGRKPWSRGYGRRLMFRRL